MQLKSPSGAHERLVGRELRCTDRKCFPVLPERRPRDPNRIGEHDDVRHGPLAVVLAVLELAALDGDAPKSFRRVP